MSCAMSYAQIYILTCLYIQIYILKILCHGQIYIYTCLYARIRVLPCPYAKFLHIYMQVSTPICLNLCFHILVCLDLCSLHALCQFSMCLCILCHDRVPTPRLCLSCQVLSQPFCHFIFLSCVLASWFNLIQTLWSLSLSINLGPYQRVWITPFCMSMLACFYALSLCWFFLFQALLPLTPSAGLWLCGHIRHP